MKRRNAMTSAGLAALGAATLFGASLSNAQANPPNLEPNQTIVVDAVGTAAVADRVPPSLDPVFSVPHSRWAIGVAIGTAFSAFISLVGFNGALQFLARAAKSAGNAAASAATIPVRAVKIAAVQTAKVLKTPGKWIFGTTAVTLAFVATVILLDVQWKAGLAIGAGTALAGVVGTKHIKKMWRDRRPAKPTPAHA